LIYAHDGKILDFCVLGLNKLKFGERQCFEGTVEGGRMALGKPHSTQRARSSIEGRRGDSNSDVARTMRITRLNRGFALRMCPVHKMVHERQTAFRKYGCQCVLVLIRKRGITKAREMHNLQLTMTNKFSASLAEQRQHGVDVCEVASANIWRVIN
jgi:hypothetical protein